MQRENKKRNSENKKKKKSDGGVWNFSLSLSFRPHCGFCVGWASNRNEYQVYSLGVKTAGA